LFDLTLCRAMARTATYWRVDGEARLGVAPTRSRRGSRKRLYERGYEFARRDPAKRDPTIVARVERQIDSALLWLEELAPSPWLFGDQMSRDDVTARVAFTYLIEKHHDFLARRPSPVLEAHSRNCEALPQFALAASSASEGRAQRVVRRELGSADLRVHSLWRAIILFRQLADGFGATHLSHDLAALSGRDPDTISQGAITYQLRRLRLNGLIVRLPNTFGYRVTEFRLPGSPVLHALLRPPLRPGLAAALPRLRAVDTPLKRCECQIHHTRRQWYPSLMPYSR
jgi:hypothetical protein